MKVYLKENPSFYCYLFWHYSPPLVINNIAVSVVGFSSTAPLLLPPQELTWLDAFNNVWCSAELFNTHDDSISKKSLPDACEMMLCMFTDLGPAGQSFITLKSGWGKQFGISFRLPYKINLHNTLQYSCKSSILAARVAVHCCFCYQMLI